jgi:hypothetical protein
MSVPSHGRNCRKVESYSTPCPKCGVGVVYYECSCGSKVFLDFVGGSHECNKIKPGSREAQLAYIRKKMAYSARRRREYGPVLRLPSRAHHPELDEAVAKPSSSSNPITNTELPTNRTIPNTKRAPLPRTPIKPSLPLKPLLNKTPTTVTPKAVDSNFARCDICGCEVRQDRLDKHKRKVHQS